MMVSPGNLAVAATVSCLALAAIPARAEWPWPAEEWEAAAPEAMGLDPALLAQAREYALTGGGAGIIVRGGRVVMTWGDPARRYDLKSTSKSIGVTALGLALADGLIGLDDRARDHHPTLGEEPSENRATGWLDDITIRQLATQSAGFAKPGGWSPLIYEPGTAWFYSDCGPNWLAECVTLAYRRDVRDLLFERVFTSIGISADDLVWRDNAYRPHEIDGIPRREFGSGVHANVDAMARIGYLYLRGGRWGDRQLLPSSFVDLVRTVDPSIAELPVHEGDPHGDAPRHYGLLWWNNADGTLAEAPRDAYWSWGLHDSLIVVIPSLDLVIARAGSDWQREGGGHYDVLQPFLGPIVAAVRSAVPHSHAPYPPSEVIVGLGWAPQQQIVRRAEGSDNWPMTWGDDDAQYTAYGDGWGFEPRVSHKLSLGFARVIGDPEDPRGENIRSATGEQLGDGRSGRKASGMLMVAGRLYMLARNAANAQLAWSDDHATTWTWADWRFETSFGCPTFINFGRNYVGARDEFVYAISFDSDSAYQPADRMVLARVPIEGITEQAAWEYFAGLDAAGAPTWSPDVTDRAAIFEYPGRCYRSGLTYCAPLGRYLWWQGLPKGSGGTDPDGRFAGGLGVYEAPEPWGPWCTVYFTESWDVGPGESGSFPTKWMSPDGRRVHLVFSGDDSFAVRRAELRLGRDGR